MGKVGGSKVYLCFFNFMFYQLHIIIRNTERDFRGSCYSPLPLGFPTAKGS